MTRPPIARWEWAWLGVVTLIGALLRFHALGTAPPGLWYDEAIYGLDAVDVMRGAHWPIFFDTEGHMREPLYMYLLAPAMALVDAMGGRGVDAVTIRGVSALIGTLTIPATWWAVRELAGPRAAALAIAFLAPMRWHVHFSRTAFRVILSPLAAVLTAGALAVAIRRRTLATAVVAGVLAGASLYTYLSLRLFVFALLGGALMAVATIWREEGREAGRAALRLVGAGVLATLLVVAPLVIHFVQRPDHFTGRQDEVSLFDEGRGGWGRLLAQARDVALMAALRGDHEAKHNIPGRPAFVQAFVWSTQPDVNAAAWRDARALGTAPADPHGTGTPTFDLVSGAVFYAGLVLMIVGAARGTWADRFALLWLVTGAAASVLSFGAPNLLRMLLLAPLAAWIVARAVDALLDVAAARGPSTLRAAQVAVAVFLIWFAAGEIRRQFVEYPRHPEPYAKFNTNFVELANWLRDSPDRPPTIVLPAYLAHHPTFRFQADGLAGLVSDDALPPAPPVGRVWWVLPAPPYPPLLIEPAWAENSRAVGSLALPDGTVWCVVMESTTSP